MYSRLLKKPGQSILLFGPRGTGKSTWIQHQFPKAIKYDLLNSQESIRLSKNPSVLYNELHPIKSQQWIIIDEVQKVPALLDEVHRLIEEKKLKFILSGSSARKLKRGSANLLAGRALTTYLFPLVSAEVDFNLSIPDYLVKGMLPMAYQSHDANHYLMSYVETYLKEEIQSEALTRNLGSFARFLEIAARQNGQITNASNIAREAMVERKTVENYFQILVDTLIGYWLPVWKLKTSNKQVTSPKFYFFDTGVVRALSGRIAYPAMQEELGPLLETALLNELRAYLAYHQLYYKIYFWRNYNHVEVDFIIETKNGFVAIECKASAYWDKKFNHGFMAIRESIKTSKVKFYGVYLGARSAKMDDVHVIPLVDFLKKLWSQEVIH